MASKTKRKGVGLRPREPGDFSGPRVGAIRLHKSSGICQIVLTEVLEDTTVLHRKMFQQEQFILPRPFCHFSYRLLELKDPHVKQAVDYAANQGVEWVVLTNGVTWRVYRVHFTKPIDNELVLEFDLLQLNPRSASHLEILYLLTREGILKDSLPLYYAQRQ